MFRPADRGETVGGENWVQPMDVGEINGTGKRVARLDVTTLQCVGCAGIYLE